MICFCLLGPTDGVALPAAASLSVAGAVHHVALLVLLCEGLVHLVGQAIHDALVWRSTENREEGVHTAAKGTSRWWTQDTEHHGGGRRIRISDSH